MNILYLGDVMGELGLQTVERVLPTVRRELGIDAVIAQAENVTEGKGLSPEDFRRLRKAGVDACTGGNWTMFRPEILSLLNDPAQPVIRPANYPEGTAGKGWTYIDTPEGKVLVVSLLGKIVGKDADVPLDNPLQKIDAILDFQASIPKAAIVVNLHGDFSSEKVVIGHYLDGRATVVVGDHWHVPTNDARVLPNGTAHQTDVGMCGSLNSSLGVTIESIIPRWRDGKSTRNILVTNGATQFNALLVRAESGRAVEAEAIRKTFED